MDKKFLYTSKFVDKEYLKNIPEEKQRQFIDFYLNKKKKQLEEEKKQNLINNINNDESFLMPRLSRLYKKSFFKIDSKFRNLDLYPNNSSVEYPLVKKYNNVISMKLIESNIPREKVITEKNNKIYWRNKEDEPLADPYPIYSASISPGNYEFDDFVYGLRDEMNKIERQRVPGTNHIFEVNFDFNTNFVEFYQFEILSYDSNIDCTEDSNELVITDSVNISRFNVGDTVKLFLGSGFAGIPIEDFHKELTIKSIDRNNNTFTVEVDTVATSTETSQGSEYIMHRFLDFQLLWGDYDDTCHSILGFPKENSSITLSNNPLTTGVFTEIVNFTVNTRFEYIIDFDEDSNIFTNGFFEYRIKNLSDNKLLDRVLTANDYVTFPFRFFFDQNLVYTSENIISSEIFNLSGNNYYTTNTFIYNTYKINDYFYLIHIVNDSIYFCKVTNKEHPDKVYFTSNTTLTISPIGNGIYNGDNIELYDTYIGNNVTPASIISPYVYISGYPHDILTGKTLIFEGPPIVTLVWDTAKLGDKYNIGDFVWIMDVNTGYKEYCEIWDIPPAGTYFLTNSFPNDSIVIVDFPVTDVRIYGVTTDSSSKLGGLVPSGELNNQKLTVAPVSNIYDSSILYIKTAHWFNEKVSGGGNSVRLSTIHAGMRFRQNNKIINGKSLNCNIEGQPYVHLCINNIEEALVSNSIVRNIFNTITFDEEGLEFLKRFFYYNKHDKTIRKIFYEPLKTLDKLQIELRTRDNELYDMNNENYQLTFEIVEIVDAMDNTNILDKEAYSNVDSYVSYLNSI